VSCVPSSRRLSARRDLPLLDGHHLTFRRALDERDDHAQPVLAPEHDDLAASSDEAIDRLLAGQPIGHRDRSYPPAVDADRSTQPSTCWNITCYELGLSDPDRRGFRPERPIPALIVT